MRAIIFDFDGLILDTETPEFKVWSETFREHGVEMPDGYWQSVIGRGAEQEIERPHDLLTRLTGSYVETPEKYEARRVQIRALIDLEVPRPGIQELIAEARASPIPLAVASSSKHVWVDKYLHRLGLFDSFNTVVCADDVTRAKPFPDLYLLACERLGVSPGEAIALEDSPNGIAAALAAGVFVAVVPNSVTALLNTSAANARFETLEGKTIQDLRNLLAN